MKQSVFILLLILSLSASGQTKDPYTILASLKDKYSGIKDYTVDATIVVDVKFLNMPVKRAKIYYKYPDKVHIETKGFALLPKRATSFNPGAFIGDKYTAIYVNSEKWGNASIDVIKTVPGDPASDVILSTFWIEEKSRQIRKLEIYTKQGGTFQVELLYNKLPFDLPEKLTVVFDVKDMTLPKSMTGEPVKKNKDSKDNKKGKVSISYSNYKVNTGLDDKLFIEKK